MNAKTYQHHAAHRFGTTKVVAGFSVLECMLAILIVALGVVGLLTLQSTSIITVHEAKMRSDAGLLANEMIGLLWVDRANLSNYALNAAATPCTVGSNASANTVVSAWVNRVGESLPGAQEYAQSITIGTGNLVTIALCWKSPQDTLPRTYSTVSQIQG